VQKRFHSQASKTHRQIKNPLSTFQKRPRFLRSYIVISLFLARSPVVMDLNQLQFYINELEAQIIEEELQEHQRKSSNIS
jgi:hypothetical protein